MTTVRDIINGALRLIDELGEGQTASNETIADGLTAMTQMMDSWGASGDLVFTETREAFNLVSGQASYTWGTGGTFNSTRPYVIKSAFIVQGGITYPVASQDWDQYALVDNKTQPGLPAYFYNDGNYPLSNIVLWYVPDQNYSLNIYSWKPLGTYSNVNDTLVAPPGWERALRFNLACEFAPEFGKTATAKVEQLANRALKIIKAANTEQQNNLLRTDVALQAMSWPNRFGYNILTGY